MYKAKTISVKQIVLPAFKSKIVSLFRMVSLVLIILGYVQTQAQTTIPTRTQVSNDSVQNQNGMVTVVADLNLVDLQYANIEVRLRFRYTHNGETVRANYPFNNQYVGTSRTFRPRYTNSTWRGVTFEIPVSLFETSIHAHTVTPYFQFVHLDENALIGQFNSDDSVRLPYTSEIVLYEGNNRSQDVLCRLPLPAFGSSVVHNLTSDNYGCENDEARSLLLRNVPQGTVITVYDSSNCSQGDDYTIITVTRNTAWSVVNTFESDFSDNYLHSNYRTAGDIDGKVSCVRISR